ncbi:Transmembrane protein 128 [Trichoplax sp. H2]|nr:Transmembrane protein 128 [Trichoplax sp. H2]|eukprot:RDD41987.1 Transmembrane protein 128 [Trichoplax sp. H2]
MEGSAKLRKRFETTYKDFVQDSNMKSMNEVINPDDAVEAARQQSITRSTAWKTAESVIWLLAALGILRYTDFLLIVCYDPRINRLWLYAGAGFLVVFSLIGCWLIIWYKIILKIDDYQKRVPAAIPIATTSFILSFGCFTYALWPVWGILTPLLLFTLMMGVIVTVSLF